ncbi:MAG: PQQ-binding-like beta-propeller repeat protein [Anaerolineae bacterium]|nr:PQQ-binding-like beta-propeller repeat protein [Anaerolineae bacterium]
MLSTQILEDESQNAHTPGDNLADVDASDTGDWPMAGANPQRTSWNSEQVPGKLSPIWYRVIEPYIPPNVQVIAANSLLYLSTAGGLYAFDAQTGNTAWVYPTELPLGNSPTIFDGVAYVGGHDHKIHAIDAYTGSGIWTFEAGAGFDTNPLVLDLGGHTFIYAGNRDGAMYALENHGSTVSLLWKYETQGPIPFSAAYRDNTLYFASNDARAYALNAQTGQLVWQSARLPGAGFQAWWPVLYEDPASGRDVVLLAGSNNYRAYLEPAYGNDLQIRELEDVFPNRASEPKGTPFGSRNPDGTLDATRALQYFEAKPWRRTYFVLDRATGVEVTFDFDGDSTPEYAPILWFGTHSGNRYPPVVGSDGVAYQSNAYMSGEWIAGGQIAGWAVGSRSISTPSADWIAMDEPMAYSAGGNLIYWSHCNDRSAGAFDISVPNTRFYPSLPDPSREWTYFSYDLDSRLPGYNVLYEGVSTLGYTINNLFQGVDASPNGIYGQHGHQNPPIPYAGKVYIHRSNALIALGDYQGQPTQLPMAHTVAAPETDLVVDGSQLREKLAVQVRKMVNVGHLRPGYRSHGLLDNKTRDQLGDHSIDYWHNTADTLYVLALALPHLPLDLQGQVKAYMQSEFAAYPPYQYTHVGWRDGAPREPYELPQEVEVDRINHPPYVSGYGYDGWTWPPTMFYALWEYAQVFGGAGDIFTASRSRLESPPSDAYLIEYPYVHNAYIAGYLGYLELEALAGYPESTGIRATLNRLLALRASTFSKDTPYIDGSAARSFSVARNFMFLVPGLGQYLRENILGQVQEAVDEYSSVAPYWFVADYYTAHGESASQHFYDYHALFLARAMILKESREELTKYLDVPAVQVGDLFYIQNLVAAIEASSGLGKTASLSFGDQGDAITFTLSFYGSGNALVLTDTLPAGTSAPGGFELVGTSVLPTYDSGTRRLLWSDTPSSTLQVQIRYIVTIITSDSRILVNTAELSDENGDTSMDTATVFANPYLTYLPLVCKARLALSAQHFLPSAP